jgi:hypothetical protein
MNSELGELFDKEGEEGGEEAEVDEDAEDIEREDEGDGDTLEGGGEGVKKEERRLRTGVQGGSGSSFSCIMKSSSSSFGFFSSPSPINHWCKVSTRWFCPFLGRTLW